MTPHECVLYAFIVRYYANSSNTSTYVFIQIMCDMHFVFDGIFLEIRHVHFHVLELWGFTQLEKNDRKDLPGDLQVGECVGRLDDLL